MARDSTTLTPDQIATLVDRFYDRIQVHPTLGPVFNAAVDDWPEHKRLLTSFWASVALGAGSYRGNPMAKHRGHPIEYGHFDEWLELWLQTCHELLSPEDAGRMHAYATRIGRSLRGGLGLVPGGKHLGIPVLGA
ncbi:group III truncated hemoglobin [Lysobacter sp. GX 14042]|uniref:group III truncated hemoglobin n=1 Tax=Lysobacter sp. GX 14042 TaxID=2907155 RepID=UPI001F2EA2F4|nr:group III truncated hemoglobin [Lysobacter sp. GX 14042]MCE7033552.1 group III truncated hemoglobin [Lysobacter sp. GX 14042]